MVISDLLSVAATRALSVLERHAFVRQLGLDKRPLQRLLLVECECNLALLACLRLDEPETPQCDNALLSVGSRLQTDVLEAVLGAGDLGSKVFRSLKNVPLMPDDTNGAAEDDLQVGAMARGKVSEKLRRLYVSAFAVRSAAAFYLEFAESRPASLRELRFKTRLRNLRAVYVGVSQGLYSELGDDAA